MDDQAVVMDEFGRRRVAEAALPLLDGETVELFRSALEAELRKLYATRGVRSWRFFQEDLHGDWVLVCLYPDSDADAAGESRSHERVPFTRSATGAFFLGTPETVRPTRGAERIGGEGAAAESVSAEVGLPDGGRAAEAEGSALEVGRRVTEARHALRRAVVLQQGRGQAITAAEALVREHGADRTAGLVADLGDVGAGRHQALHARHLREGLTR